MIKGKDENSIKNMNKSYINYFFDKVFCINLDKRKDRLNLVEKELSKHNVVFERFSAIDGETINKKDYTTNSKIPVGHIGCTLSHAKLIKLCKEKGYKKVLILEDDVVFKENFEELFKEYIKEVPEDWNMFYLGGNHNVHVGNKLEMVTKHVGKCNQTFSTHAYAINESLFDEAISVLSKGEKQVDIYYSEIQKRKKIYTFFPGIANQRIGYSDILNKDVDYSNIIQ